MEKTLKIYYTSDTHGRLFPEDATNGACLAQTFAEYQKDENTLVLDGGDTLQGSPLLRYLWKQDQCADVLPAVMNRSGLDYYTLGNHDFNYGYAGLAGYLNAVQGDCLCANVSDTAAAPLPINPYAIHTLGNGLRIGIVGVVTDYVNLWEAEENLTNLVVSDAFAAAKQALNDLKFVKGGVDYTICIYHGGFEADITSAVRDVQNAVQAQLPSVLQASVQVDLREAAPLSVCEKVPAQGIAQQCAQETHTPLHAPMRTQENVGCKICKELDFDLLLTAHQHMEAPFQVLDGTAVLQLPANAQKYAHLEIAIEVAQAEKGSALENVITAKQPTAKAQQAGVANMCNMDKSNIRILRAEHIVPTTAPDAALLKQMQSVRSAAQQWLSQPAGTLAKAVPPVRDKIALALGDASLAQLANFAQLQASGAEVAITSLPNQPVGLPAQLSIGDVLTAYPFPNAVITLAVSGAVLAKGIARSAAYFALDATEQLCVSQQFTIPKEEHYNYDFFGGVAYTISFEAGVAALPTVRDILVNGEPLDPTRSYQVVMSDYRATGTGGYDFYADCPRVASHPCDVQALILETLAHHPQLEIPTLSAVQVVGCQSV